jgi:tRNA-splicing endonuclease subunit Sen54
MPTLEELTDLFDVLPEAPLPVPRQKRPPPGASSATPTPAVAAPPVVASEQTLLQKLFPWFFNSASAPSSTAPARKTNPFVALKSGKKIVIIAVVDASNTSFFRFGQGEFTEWPMV